MGRGKTGDGAGERRLLKERLQKADQGLEQFSQQFERQSADLKSVQEEAQQARESAAASITELKGVSQERDELKAGHVTALGSMEQIKKEKEALSKKMAEVAEQLLY